MCEKICPCCKVNPRSRGAYCKPCNAVRSRKFYDKEYNKRWRQAKGKEYLREQKKNYRHAIRAEGLAAYGGRCTCCGESIQKFLTIEHLVPRDSTLPKEKQRGHNEWLRLKRMGWPKEGYTILCFNCNSAKGIYGECPHKQTNS